MVDAVRESESGLLVPPGDAADFAQVLLDLLTKPPKAETPRAFAAKLVWERFGQRVSQVLRSDARGGD